MPGPLIAHGQHHLVAVHIGLDDDAVRGVVANLRRRRVFDGIVDQVSERLADELSVALHRGRTLRFDLERQPLVLGEGLVKLAHVAGDFGHIELGHALADLARLGPGNHQERIEGADKPHRFFDGFLKHAPVIGLGLRVSQRRFAAIAQPRERRLKVVSDVVGHLLEAAHQRFDALQHAVQVEGEAIEFVGAAGNRQPARKVAGHDGLRRRGHRFDAIENAPAHEQAARHAEEDDERHRPTPGKRDDVEHPLALFEVAADQQPDTARKPRHQHERVVLSRFGLLQPTVGGLDPALPLDDAGLKRADIAGKALAGRRGDEIEV